MAAFDANVCNGDGRAPAHFDARVAGAVHGVGHVDLDIGEVGALGDAPVEGDKRRAAGDVGGVEDDVLDGHGERQFARDACGWVLAVDQGVAREAGCCFQDRGLFMGEY